MVKFIRKTRRKAAPRRGIKKRRFRTRTQPNKSMVSYGLGMPKRIRAKLKYTDNYSLTTYTDSQIWRVNGAYDPDQTGVGHQPRIWDQITATHLRYKVHGLKYTITFVNEAAAPVNVFLMPKNDVSFPVIAEAQEIPNVKWVTLGGAASSKSAVTIKGYLNLKKLFGERLTDDDFGSSVSTVPTRQWYLHAVASHPTAPTATNAVCIIARLTYYTEFYEVNDFANS